ncbi:MAG: DNA gyrase inhibitor YacG [Methylococcales bacterium]|nr:DNA gyrase inhibitor YacG [Methylococcales bacterium]
MANKKQIVVSCPTCQKQVIWNEQQTAKPFCSERCKLIDLGEWAAEEKTIPGNPLYSEADFDSLLQ